jgi:PAS domain S-box-containing protein
MTDTVLVTDDAGEFTYVCPNVHFIFGYSAAEVREMGTIDALLGADLYDPAALEEAGVLTNIECTAQDKAGNEHTLLVNVREVDVQGGTTLYSCRDVTKRKSRERALTALHRTSRDLLYAETDREIARQVADDVTDVLDVPGGAVFLFDSGEHVLRPAAVTPGFETLDGPAPTVGPQETSLVSHTFVEQTPAVYEDVHGSEHLRTPATDVRSAILTPLGDHGVLVVASDAAGAFDDVAEEIASLLAATAEAALDRIEREMTLRERDRELRRRNRELARLNRTNAIIREIDQSLVGAGSREEIEHAVCDRLTASDRFEFAWIGARRPGTGEGGREGDGEGSIEPRAWAGADSGYLDEVALGPAGDATEPAVRTIDAGEPTVVGTVGENLGAGDWRGPALSRGYQSVASVPIAHDDRSYGVLTVYAGRPDAVDETGRTVLRELGGTIAAAVRSVERKNALMSDAVTELEYRVTDRSCLLYALAEAADCALEIKGGVHRTSDGARMLVAVEGARVEQVVDTTRDVVSIADVTPVVSAADGGVVRLTVTAPFLAARLADAGAAMRSFEATPDGATVSIDVPRPVEIRAVDDVVAETYPSATLVAQRERDRSVMTRRQFRAEFLDAVTDRQLEVVQTAYYSGYFESPRRNAGRAVADTLDISASAFYDHVRKVQRTLFATLLDDPVPTRG